MRRLLVVMTVVMMIALAMHAQTPQPTYVGLFADMERSIASASAPGEFSLYVWWLPGSGGIDEVGYNLVVPGNVERTQMVLNPAFHQLCEQIQCGRGGICATADNCQSDWVWSHRIDCRLLDSAPGLIEITGCRAYLPFTTSACDTGLVEEQPVVILNSFGLNQPEVISIDQATWGAIKSLYR